MKLDNSDMLAIIRMFETCNGDVKTARGMLELWLDEKCAEAYKEGWQDCCEEYDIDDDSYADDSYDAGDIIYDGY